MKRLLTTFVWLPLVLGACGGEGGEGPSGGSLQDEGTLLCPDGYQNGRGYVWRGGDPGALDERDIPCLDGSGSLAGYYLATVSPDRGEAAFSAENRFFYDTGDDRVSQVQAYYAISHMANWVLGRFVPRQEFTDAIEVIRSDQINLEYQRPEVDSQQLCYSLHVGMQGLDTTLLNVDVMCHEFGHHLVFSLNRNISNAMIHEALADYLAASFTQDAVIEPSRWPGFDRSLENDYHAPGDIITRGRYCVLMLSRMENDGMDQVYTTLADTFRSCRSQNPQEPEPHWASQILSAALWELRGRIGEAAFHPVLFTALHGNDINDTGDLLENLVAKDAEINQGENESIMRQAFASRGIEQNLSLDFPELPYSQCP